MSWVTKNTLKCAKWLYLFMVNFRFCELICSYSELHFTVSALLLLPFTYVYKSGPGIKWYVLFQRRHALDLKIRSVNVEAAQLLLSDFHLLDPPIAHLK